MVNTSKGTPAATGTDTESSEDRAEDRTEIQAVSRAAQILALFAPSSPELSAADVADRLGLNRTTAYRYCTSLVSAGLLERGTEAGRFVPGRLLLQLGTFALGRRRVVDLAPAHLQALCRGTGMTAVLSLWGSSGPVVTRVEEDTSRTVVVSVRVGGHLQFTTAQSKVFLAHLRDQLTVARLLANVPQPLHGELVAEIEQVRERGHCAASSTPGVVAVAAPVFDEAGICATVAVVGTDNLLSTERDAPELGMLLDVTRALTLEMGGATWLRS